MIAGSSSTEASLLRGTPGAGMFGGAASTGTFGASVRGAPVRRPSRLSGGPEGPQSHGRTPSKAPHSHLNGRRAEGVWAPKNAEWTVALAGSWPHEAFSKRLGQSYSGFRGEWHGTGIPFHVLNKWGSIYSKPPTLGMVPFTLKPV